MILAITIAIIFGSGLLTTIASLMRCRKCGGWHESALEEDRCKGHCHHE